MFRRLVTGSGVLVVTLGCGPDAQTFDTSVLVKRGRSLDQAPNGESSVFEVAIRWPSCPGEPQQVLLGGGEFAQCMGKHRDGATVPARVESRRSEHGDFEAVVLEIGGCKREQSEHDEGSYVVVRECETLQLYGAAIGFHCDLLGSEELVVKCPWFRRH